MTQEEYKAKMKELWYSDKYINNEMLTMFSEVSGELSKYNRKGMNPKYMK